MTSVKIIIWCRNTNLRPTPKNRSFLVADLRCYVVEIISEAGVFRCVCVPHPAALMVWRLERSLGKLLSWLSCGAVIGISTQKNVWDRTRRFFARTCKVFQIRTYTQYCPCRPREQTSSPRRVGLGLGLGFGLGLGSGWSGHLNRRFARPANREPPYMNRY